MAFAPLYLALTFPNKPNFLIPLSATMPDFAIFLAISSKFSILPFFTRSLTEFISGSSANSNNKESAHYYINAILDAEIGKNIAVNNQLATANLMAFEILKDSYKNDPRIFPDSQIIERYEDTSIIMDFDYEKPGGYPLK